MDEALVKALNELSDDLGLPRLDEVLADPEPHIYDPGCRDSSDRTQSIGDE